PRLREPRNLFLLDLGVYRESRDRRLLARRVLIDPDDDLLPLLDLLLEVKGGFRDLALGKAPVDRLDHPAHLLDLPEVAVEASLHALRERLEVVRARERVDRVRDPGLVRDDLLRAKRQG